MPFILHLVGTDEWWIMGWALMNSLDAILVNLDAVIVTFEWYKHDGDEWMFELRMNCESAPRWLVLDEINLNQLILELG